MALLTRVSRLLKADFNAVLDQLEEPVSLLKQSIREMEEALAERERRIGRLRADRQDLDKRLREAEGQVAEIDRQLDLCFASGNDSLARRLVRRKLEAAKLAALTRERIDDVADALTESEAALEHERTELAHLRNKADCFVEPAPAERAALAERSFGIGDDEVEVAFLHEKQRRAAS